MTQEPPSSNVHPTESPLDKRKDNGQAPPSPAAIEAAKQSAKPSLPMAISICLGILLAAALGIFFYRLTWFILVLYLSFIAATVLEAPVHWLTRHGVRRGFAAVLVCLTTLILVSTLLYFIAVGMYNQSNALTAKLADAPKRIEFLVNRVKQHFPGLADGIPNFDFRAAIAKILPDLSTLWTNALSGVEIISLMVIIFFLVLYMLVDGADHLKAMRTMLPKDSRLEATKVFREMSAAHRGWAFASFANVCSATLLMSTGLYVLGVPGALLLGLLAGLGELIPNIGPFLGALPALLITLLADPDKFPYVVAMFIILQTIQSYTISPLMLRFSVKLPVLVTIISVLVFGTLFGFLGIVVAIPLVADMVVIWNYLSARREQDAIDYDAVNAPADSPRAPIAPDHSPSRLAFLHLRRHRAKTQN